MRKIFPQPKAIRFNKLRQVTSVVEANQRRYRESERAWLRKVRESFLVRCSYCGESFYTYAEQCDLEWTCRWCGDMIGHWVNPEPEHPIPDPELRLLFERRMAERVREGREIAIGFVVMAALSGWRSPLWTQALEDWAERKK